MYKTVDENCCSAVTLLCFAYYEKCKRFLGYVFDYDAVVTSVVRVRCGPGVSAISNNVLY